MTEKELIHDLHEKKEIRKNVEDRQKAIDKSKDDTKDDVEVYMAAQNMIDRYRLAYRLNLVTPGQTGKTFADQILRSNVSNNLVLHKNLEKKYRKENPEAANRADNALRDFNLLKEEIDKDIRKLKNLIDSKLIYRVGDIGPNLDRIASRINTAEEKVRGKAEAEISQQNTNSLAEESAKEMADVQNKQGNEKEKLLPKTYMKRDGDKFVFTKESNPVKIHEVMSAFIKEKPDATFLLDYSGCIGNDKLKADIMKRTGNNSLQVYIKYNPNIKTYDFYNTEGKLLEGKRPYIWEGVTLMTKEVEGIVLENKRQEEIEAKTNVDYKALSNDLENNFPEQIATLKQVQLTKNCSLYDELSHGKWGEREGLPMLKDFLVYTETRLDEVIKRRRANARIDQDDPIDTGDGLLNANFVTPNGKTSVPLFVKEQGRGAASVPDYIYSYISSRKSVLKSYMKERLLTKRDNLSHMERREKVVNLEKPAPTTNNNEKIEQERNIETKKELQLYGLDKLLEIVSNLEKKDENTPTELVAFTQHIESIRNDISKAPKGVKVSERSRQEASKEAQRLFIDYKNNDGSFASMTDETAKNLIAQIFKAESRSKIQEAASELGINMTLFDNTSRAGVVQDIIDDGSEANQNYYESRRKKEEAGEVTGNEKPPMEINKEEYDKCFQKMCQLSYISVNEETGEIGPQKNMEFIDKLMACETTNSSNLDTILLDYGIITKEIANEDNHAYNELKDRILETIKNKREMEKNFELSREDMKKKYKAEIEELKRKTTLNDEEMERMAILMGLIEDDELLNRFAEDQTENGKKMIRYCGMDDLLHEHITPYLAKHGGGISGTNSEIYNDSKGLRGRRDWTDENCEKISSVLEDILIEVAITAVAIGLGAISGGAGTALVMGLRATAVGARVANYANKINKFLKIAKLCENMGKGINTAKKGRLLTALRNSRLGKSYARATAQGIRGESRAANFIGRRLATASETRGGRLITQATEWTKGTKLWKGGKSLGEIVQAGNIARTEGSLGMKAVGMIFEGTGFHVASTALHNAINGENLLNGLNPLDNFKGYAQSIAFLGVLKFLGKPINTMTSTSIEFALGEKISASQFGHAIKYIAGIGGEFGTLVATDEILNVVFEGELKEMTTEDAIHSIGMILGLRLHGKIKEIKKLTIKEYNKAKKELTVDFGEGEVKINENEVFNSEPKHKRTPEQEKLNNQYKRMERQSKYNEEFKQAKDLIKEIPENLRSESMKKFLEAGDMIELGFHEIKEIQREIGLKGKEVDGVLGPKTLKRLREYVSKNGGTNEALNNRVKDKATEILHKKFDELIMSENGITIDGITYKLERKPNEGDNPNRKGRVVYTETGPDGKVRVKIEANSDTFSLPENSNGNNIRERYNKARGKYVEKNLNSTLESARQELDGEYTRDIESRSRDLEGRRNNRATLEGRKKNLSEEIDGLKSRKAQLEQQLQKTSKELTIQPDISSLKDIYTIIKEGNKITIGGKKCTFIGVKGDKIVFTEGRGKTREFSSFKELQEAGANFNFDIKNRQSDRGLEQQIQFEELVEKEARTKNANDIIREYEQLQRQKSQIEQDIHDGFFRENADRLVKRHIWIDNVEYQCTGKNTNNGKTTLDFKQTDGSDHFTISSFEGLRSKGQEIKGYKVLKTDLPGFQKETHELLWGESGNPDRPGLLNGKDKYVNQKRQTLQQVDQQLQNGRTDYDNAKLATSPKKTPNPEYEKIQKEIEGIDAQLIGKGQQLATIERDLGASDTEIARLEQEITKLTAEKNNLNGSDGGKREGNREGNGEGNREGNGEIGTEIKKPEDVEINLDELLYQAKKGNYENVKLDWVTKAMFEGSVYFEGLSRFFKKNRTLPRKFVKTIRDKLVEMKNKCRNSLTEAKKKLVERWNNFFSKKFAENGNELEIKEDEINAIERINQNERPDRGINTERREMSEVQRNSDVVAIGDLHGEYGALKGNMEYAGLAKEVNGHLEWTGGNKKVVFQGDILADRGTDGLKIIKEIHQLREQARQHGGDIDIVVGNHDDFFITYLLGGKVSRFSERGEASALDIAMNGDQGKGLTELLDFIGIKRSGEFDDFLSLTKKNIEILNAMKNSPEGRLILEEICNMKLISQVDDVLYCHTNPTSNMLAHLTRGGNIQNNINLLNQKYQGFLRKALLGEGNGAITTEEFNNISNIFLNTGNRYTGLNSQYAKILRDNGINMISHGHNGGSGRYGYTNNQLEIGGVRVIDTDNYYGNRGNFSGQHSVSVIKKEGGVNYMGDNVAYANLEYPIGTEVYVKLDKGGEKKAKVESYNPITKEYTVSIDGNTDIGTVLKAESLRKPMDTEFALDKGNQIRRYKTELPTEGLNETHIQETESRLNELITESDKPKLNQKGFKKEYPDEQCENDVQRFIERAQEKEITHKQIFLDLGKETNAQALFIGPPKKADRIVDKVKNEYLAEGEGGLEAITDFTRSTLLFDNYSEFVKGIEVLKQMQKEGRIAKLRIKNRIKLKGCNDMLINIETPDGYISEVQFHIPETLILKDGFLGPQVENLYKEKFGIEFDKYIFTEKIYDLKSDNEYQNKKNKYEEIINKINEVKNKKFKLPEQGKEIHGHDVYDIRRILDTWEKDSELKGQAKLENVTSLNETLQRISNSLADEARKRYGNRTIL